MRYLSFFFLAVLFSAAFPLSAQWAPVLSIPETDVFALFTGENTWYAATDGQIFASVDAGAHWDELPSAPSGISALYADAAALYAGTVDEGVYRSFNGGQSWQQLAGGLTGSGPRSITCFLSRGDSLFAGTEGGVYFIRKSQAAPSWQGFSQGLAYNNSYSINALAFTGSALLAGAGANGHLYWRGINEAAWQPIPISDPFSSGLTAYSFAQLGDAIFAGTYLGVFRSADGGMSWQRQPGQLPFSVKYMFARQGRLLAITNRLEGGALYISSDEGLSWEFLGHFPGSNLYGLELSDEYIYLASQFGLLRAPLDIISEIPEPDPFENNHIQNLFPNPAGSQARLAFTLGEGADVRAELYDNTGRQVRGIASAFYPAGEHTADIALDGLPAGAYVLRCWIGTSQESRWLVVR